MKKFIKKKIIKKTTDSAVVGIVSAVLIIGLIAAVVSLVQTVYVPKIMEQREAEHMDKVAEQFTYLTSVIDGQAADEQKSIPIATSITLGNRELPFLVSTKAFGTLEILENSCEITILNESIDNTYPLGTISYSSTNSYFLDQSYTYEAGAMIVSQSQGNLMMIRPSFFVDYNLTLNISFDVVSISGLGQKRIAAGFGTYPIQTEFLNISKNITYTNVSDITITTSHSNAWYVFIDRSLRAAELNSTKILTDTGQAVVLDFSLLPPELPVNFNLKIINIRAQIGPGWVD